MLKNVLLLSLSFALSASVYAMDGLAQKVTTDQKATQLLEEGLQAYKAGRNNEAVALLQESSLLGNAEALKNLREISQKVHAMAEVQEESAENVAYAERVNSNVNHTAVDDEGKCDCLLNAGLAHCAISVLFCVFTAVVYNACL